MIALALALVAAVASARQEGAWAQLWTELEALRGGKTSPAEASVFHAHLVEALEQSGPGPRTELLRAALESLGGRDVSAAAVRLAALEPTPFTPRELWFLGDLLPTGPERVRVVLAALEGPAELEGWQVLLAWNTAVDEARSLRLEESALPIQLALHERYAETWPNCSEDLALTYRALGQGKAADRVLEQAIASELAAGRRSPSLWEARGINALGFGDEPTARDYLGRALAHGSEGAALLLARLDLAAGRSEAARLGFRALILNQPPPDWAWRGWGTALLPRSFAAPATRPTAPNE